MNYDLAVMALEGLARAPMSIRAERGEIVIEGEGASFKELARLCLLLGSAQASVEDGVELQPGTHVTKDSAKVRLKLK